MMIEALESRRLLSTAYPSGVPLAVPATVQAENFDLGAQGDAYHDTTAGNSGGAYRSTNVDIGTGEGGYVLGWVKAGEWLTYTINVQQAGLYKIETRWAAPGGGNFKIEFAGQDKTGVISVPNTGSWNAWQTAIKADVPLAAGVQQMRVVMLANGSSGYVGNFNWIRLTRTGDVTPEPPLPPSGQPGEANTGPTGPLTDTGSISSLGHNTTIQNVNVSGLIYINHNNVTVRNFRINAGGLNIPYAVRIAEGVTGTVFEDGEATNFGAAFCYRFTNYTARRMEVHRVGADAFKSEGNVILEGNWIHHLGLSVGSHADGIQVSKGRGHTFRGNFIDMPWNKAGTRANATIFISKSDVDDVLIEGNWLNGGNYTLHLDASGGGNFVVRDNLFGRDFRYGISRRWGDVAWSNNRFWDNGALIL